MGYKELQMLVHKKDVRRLSFLGFPSNLHTILMHGNITSFLHFHWFHALELANNVGLSSLGLQQWREWCTITLQRAVISIMIVIKKHSFACFPVKLNHTNTIKLYTNTCNTRRENNQNAEYSLTATENVQKTKKYRGHNSASLEIGATPLVYERSIR